MALGDIPLLGGAAKLGLTGLNAAVPGAQLGTGIANTFLGTNYSPLDPTVGFGAGNVIKTQASNLGNAVGSAFNGSSAPAQSATATSAPQPSADQTNPQVLGAYTGTNGASGTSVDPTIGQYYDQMTNNVNSELGRLPNQLQIGQQNIQNAYQSALGQLLNGKSVADRNYQTSKDQALQNEVQNEGDINFQTGQQTNALQRLLGAAGFGSSAAAQQAVPYATGLVGNTQLRNAQQAYGRNQQALDTSYGDYTNAYNQNVNGLGQQRDQQSNALQASIDQNKASLLSQLANIAQQRASTAPGATYADIVKATQPYQDQINSLGGQIDQLGLNPTMAFNNPAYQAPALESYVPQQTAAQVPGAPGAASNLGAYTNLLLNGAQQQQTNLAGQPVAG